MGTPNESYSSEDENYDPYESPHPVFAFPNYFVTVRIGRLPFVLDTENGDRVPAFLFALFRKMHVEHLATLTLDPPYSFLMLLNCWRSVPPMEAVRLIADFLKNTASSLEDCMAVLNCQTPLFNFYVLRSLLRDAQPPLLYLDYDTCVTMEESNVVFPLGTFADTRMEGIFPMNISQEELLLQYDIETNPLGYNQRLSMQMTAVNCHIFKELMCIPYAFHRAVVRFILYNLCALIREVAIRENESLNEEVNVFFMPRMVFRSRFLQLIVWKMANYIADDVITLDTRWVIHKYLESDLPPQVDIPTWMDEEEAKLRRRALMNILCANINCLWLRGCTLEHFCFDEASRAVVELFAAEWAGHASSLNTTQHQ
ncbi:unnamed protein product [Hydatigera taeniaeformis]|uniref:Expressed conserved protein n=1 Tax=Hydatigena taeniaeformis TaxID=6205 RepID=A0A0R3X4D1_HYDTA|nr:unnamed protein product [Hydatigera taeniaeformis]